MKQPINSWVRVLWWTKAHKVATLDRSGIEPNLAVTHCGRSFFESRIYEVVPGADIRPDNYDLCKHCTKGIDWDAYQA